MPLLLTEEYIGKVKEGKKSHNAKISVLDLGSGKGGDLFKWEKAQIHHLICVDIAEISVQQCQGRYDDLAKRNRRAPFTAEFIAADCTRVNIIIIIFYFLLLLSNVSTSTNVTLPQAHIRQKYRDASIDIDLTSCQFVFHYSFESLPQAECMLKNASENLRHGGYFIGTIPNSYELV